MNAWPSFRKTLGWPALIAGAALHVATRTVDLLAHHLLYEKQS